MGVTTTEIWYGVRWHHTEAVLARAWLLEGTEAGLLRRKQKLLGFCLDFLFLGCRVFGSRFGLIISLG
ncbi:hypothetical protein ES319_A04G101400v1 [Gossypium barbadense]|uniref:Uncharacterized protein n=2 Tax=Gossypium TaxID=3633 RepID=A0A5J5W5E2_GOSBA|nr:hypothetical protein ES319_A04G101400v1 [Gossypium barbadense]TYH22276.1 hypothetical protein ES288_A04G114400v1 [Gossypium darwinii]